MAKATPEATIPHHLCKNQTAPRGPCPAEHSSKLSCRSAVSKYSQIYYWFKGRLSQLKFSSPALPRSPSTKLSSYLSKFHQESPPGNVHHRTGKTKEDRVRDQLDCTYQSPSRGQRTYSSYPRSIRKRGLKTRLQQESKVHPGGRAGNRYPSKKQGGRLQGSA